VRRCAGVPLRAGLVRRVCLHFRNVPIPLMRDTEPGAENVRLAAIRRMTPAERVRQALELSEWAKNLALAGLRERHPACSEVELVALLLGARPPKDVRFPGHR